MTNKNTNNTIITINRFTNTADLEKFIHDNMIDLDQVTLEINKYIITLECSDGYFVTMTDDVTNFRFEM